MLFRSLRIYRLFPALLFALSFAVAGEPNLPEVHAPWMKGERLEFDLCWGPITAGSASLEVKPVKDGKTEFLTFATGNKTINKIYPVNDTIYTRVRNKGLMTEVFRKRLHEGTFHNTSVIRFDRGIDYQVLIDFLKENPVQNIAFTGPAGHRMLEMCREQNALPQNFIETDDYEAIVRFCYEKTPVGGTALLSPAAASYNQFKNFEERGETFKQLVISNW